MLIAVQNKVAEAHKVISARFFAGASSDRQIPPQQHQGNVLGSNRAAPTENSPEQKTDAPGKTEEHPKG
jgi:hypothetical protein